METFGSIGNNCRERKDFNTGNCLRAKQAMMHKSRAPELKSIPLTLYY